MPASANPNQSPDKNATMIATLLIFVSLVVNYMFVAPALQTNLTTNNKLNATIKANDQNLTTLKQIKDQLTEGKQSMKDRGIDLAVLNAIVPPDEDIPGLYISMDRIVNDGRFANLKPSYTLGTPVLSPTGGAQISVAMTAAGEYANLKNLLNELRINIRPVVVTGISLARQASEKGQTSNTWAMTVTGYVTAQKISESYGGNLPAIQ